MEVGSGVTAATGVRVRSNEKLAPAVHTSGLPRPETTPALPLTPRK